MTEVFLENQRIDITEGFSNLVTYAIDDIKDIGSKNTSFSKTIVLPGTANNNKQFGHIFDVTSSNPYNSALDNVGTNFNPSKQANCVIFQNHLQVFKGVLRLLKMIVTDGVVEYECVVFGELGGFSFAMANGKLQDLDFSSYDHTLNTANIINSWDNVSGGSFFYGLIDYGEVSNNKIDYDIRTFRPALFVKEYLEKIFAAAGYTYTAPLFDTSRFKSLIIPHNQKELTKNENVWIEALRDNSAPHYDGTVIEGTGIGSSLANWVYWDSRIILNFTSTLVAGQYRDFTYTAVQNAIVDVEILLRGNLNNDGANIYVEFRKNGSPILADPLDDTGGVDEDFEYRSSATGVPLSTGDVLDLRIYSDDAGPYRVDVNTGSLVVTSIIPTTVVIGNGDSVQMNDTIPRNVLQKEFFSSILKLFNLYAYEDPLKSKHLNIRPYIDFYDLNVSGVIDWTYKMDRSKPFDITPMSELNARYYNFKFKSDNDYYNDLYRNRYGEGYGDYLFDSEFAFGGDSSNIELIFSATPLVGYVGVDKIVSVMYKQNNGVEEKRDCNIRILQAKKITGVNPWDIYDGISTLTSALTNYGYAGHYDDPDAPANDIQFGVPKELFFTLLTGAINVTQFNVYWSSYMAEITDKDSKLLTAYFKLSSRDIFSLDFSKLIYHDSAYWRLNKIIDWNSSEPDVCKCELLKVINLLY